ncbi:LysR family transcriptional regulator [Parasphingorhabdus sp.]|uniref:LysR family transcriptional regulator n=1 Tax=Parasphingorhabdus sp. TaxID=2709688 RepID=UPI0032651AE9
MDNWDDYRFILALDRAGTVRGAALQLGVTHSTVSRRLAVINRRYAKPVMERIAGGYRKTDFGKRLIDAAEKMEAINFSADRQHRAAETELAGPITLSIPDVLGQYLLLDDLAEFCAAYPDIQLSIQSSYQFADLDRSEADVVVRGTNKPPEHFVGRRLFPYALSHYCKADYFEQTADGGHQWITGLPAARPENWIADSPYPDAPVGLMSDDISFHYQAALAGHGMIRTACYICDPDPRLIRVPHAPPPIPAADLWVLTHPDLRETPRIKLLMRFLVSALKSRRDLVEGRLNPDRSSPS